LTVSINGLVNSFLERLVNSVIQASKKIKTETEISSGATSVSFASVQYIIKNVEDISNKNILLFGTGKIGRNTCENLVKHTKHEQITLINRTKDKAEKLAQKLNLIVKDYADLQLELQKADVVVVATGAQNPTVDKAILNLEKANVDFRFIHSENVNENVRDIEGVTLIHMDHLSQMTDETLENQKTLHIPHAEAIIEEIQRRIYSLDKKQKICTYYSCSKRKTEFNQRRRIEFST
jgi:glutamyl-tRNA reductase